MDRRDLQEEQIIEQNLQWAIRRLRYLVKKRIFGKIEISIQGGVVTGLTRGDKEKPETFYKK